jgi:hypothetical protein
MKRLAVGAAGIAVALSLAAAPAPAQQPPAPAPPRAALEPAALDALKSMGAYLRSLKAFQVQAATTDEDVLDDGQKVQYDGRATILARMPDGLRAEVSNDRFDRMFFYDGRTFTLYGRRLNLFATIPAPATIGTLADQLDAEYSLTVPLVDLFRWGSDGWNTDGITGAVDLGPASVAGTTCQQFAFRTDEVDWQIWIQKGDFPLPRKLVITTRTDEARPQHTAVFTWDLAPSFSADAFSFDPPEGAGRVQLARAAGQ